MAGWEHGRLCAFRRRVPQSHSRFPPMISARSFITRNPMPPACGEAFRQAASVVFDFEHYPFTPPFQTDADFSGSSVL